MSSNTNMLRIAKLNIFFKLKKIKIKKLVKKRTFQIYLKNFRCSKTIEKMERREYENEQRNY